MHHLNTFSKALSPLSMFSSPEGSITPCNVLVRGQNVDKPGHRLAIHIGMSKLPLLCNYFHSVMVKFVWSKGNQQSDLGNFTMPILLFTAKNGCKRVI